MRHINPHLNTSLLGKSLRIKSLEYYVQGISIEQDKYILSEAITLLESNQEDHKQLAYQILEQCAGTTNSSRRIAITGSPGVGKSTFIESYGQSLINQENRVAVLTIDPSSSVTSGSILGDKTRMLELAKSPRFFIRPSPSSNHLGGVHQHTYESIRLCEAAGYDHILIETVGVGQSEIEIRDFTDFVILLVLPGGGDSLQGIKKGIMETTDLIIVNKADGDRLTLAKEMMRELKDAHHSMASEATPTLAYSSIQSSEKSELLLEIDTFFEKTTERRAALRKMQDSKWLINRLKNLAIEKVLNSINPSLSELHNDLKSSQDSIFKEYLRAAKSLRISALLK